MKLTDELLKECVDRLKVNQKKFKKYKDYYDGQHDIVNDYAYQESRSNMTVVVNYFKKFINDEIAYALGNPVNYISYEGDTEVAELIDQHFSHWAKVHDQHLMKQANIYGESYELQYIADNEFKATVLNPLNCFVMESGGADRNVVLAVHEYKEHLFSGEVRYDVYHENKVYTYSEKLEQLNVQGINFEAPPLRVCAANPERQSMLDDIKSENDAYNVVLSDLVNEVSDFRQAFLKIVGAKLEPDEANKMKKSGIIQTGGNADISYLIKEINDTFVQNLLGTLEEKIYKLASHIDTNEKLQSNVSGSALRSRMIALENKCILMQSMLEQTIKARLKNFFRYIYFLTGKEYDYRKIKLKFTMNIPNDILLLADTISKLRDTVSQRTLLTLLPFVENAELELEQFYAERKKAMEGMLDLDALERIGLNEKAVAGDTVDDG
ncbi:phage portal protein [Sporosarcina sp. P17b]|uniref:phage portal protein n=1 Tax=Sporosarcina sp. P17b TaxID=2048260 RepID=UPI000C16C963|nr:phage portal protein [Sporosarcina sp. P17b]PIC72421.1 phage portal protein [Sporosarcina sp. P17b]